MVILVRAWKLGGDGEADYRAECATKAEAVGVITDLMGGLYSKKVGEYPRIVVTQEQE